MTKEIIKYIKNYRSRHANNINLILHIIGVPETVLGLFQVLTGRFNSGLSNIFIGFFIQWIGHQYVEKNEMGEITGIKKILMRLNRD